MVERKEFMINDAMVDAKPCTFAEYKEAYEIESDEWTDDCKGYNVLFPVPGTSIFFDAATFNSVTQPSEY